MCQRSGTESTTYSPRSGIRGPDRPAMQSSHIITSIATDKPRRICRGAGGFGIAEETIGRWLQRSGRRDDIVFATKVYQPMGLDCGYFALRTVNSGASSRGGARSVSAATE
jgi:hypothetical protein